MAKADRAGAQVDPGTAAPPSPANIPAPPAPESGRRLWRFRTLDEGAVAALERGAGISTFLARLLVSRGLGDPAAAARLVEPRLDDIPRPVLLNGMTEAAARSAQALRRDEKIAVFGDFDVDGLSSIALFTWFFRALGRPLETYVPDRRTEGYGLNVRAVEELRSRGVSLLFTADCGTTNQAEISRARELGMDVIVLDHHEVTTVEPPAFAFLNPKKPGSGYPDPVLCSAGLTFMFLSALRAALREDGTLPQTGEPNLKQHLDLVSLATVADVVPLLGVNRVLVRHGMDVLARTRKPGLRALLAAARVDPTRIDAHALAFYLAPRLNAAGRLGDARRALDLLTTEDDARAFDLAQELNLENQRRQALEDAILAEAVKHVAAGGAGLVVASETWHPGVIGIVAARIVERFSRPAVVISIEDGIGKGSARSVSGLDLVSTLARCADHLVKFGGHKQAAGLTVEAGRIEGFRSAFDAAVREQIGSDYRRTLWIDDRLDLGEITMERLDEIERLEPCGEANPRPVFAAEGVSLRRLRLAGRQVIYTCRQGGRSFEALVRRRADGEEELPAKAAIAYSLYLNTWQGETSIALRLRDWSAAGP